MTAYISMNLHVDYWFEALIFMRTWSPLTPKLHPSFIMHWVIWHLSPWIESRWLEKMNIKQRKIISVQRVAQLPGDDDLHLKILKRHYWPNKSHIHHCEMHMCLFYLNGQHSLHNHCRLMACTSHHSFFFPLSWVFSSCAGFSSRPFVKIASALLPHPALPRPHIFGQSSNILLRLGGFGTWKWKLISHCTLKPIPYKMQYVQPAQNFFFFFLYSPRSFWL